jgi:hypothetical protein
MILNSKHELVKKRGINDRNSGLSYLQTSGSHMVQDHVNIASKGSASANGDPIKKIG